MEDSIKEFVFGNRKPGVQTEDGDGKILKLMSCTIFDCRALAT
jgi:hypothetical protein